LKINFMSGPLGLNTGIHKIIRPGHDLRPHPD